MKHGNLQDWLAAMGRMEPQAAFWAVDEKQNIIYWSEGAERLLGYRADEVLEQHCSAGINCVRCSTGCGLMRYLSVSEKPMSHYHKDGHEVRAIKNAQALRDENGHFIGGLEMLRPLEEQAVEAKELAEPVDFHGILTRDQKFLSALTTLRHVAQTDVNVLIRGETGTGKEMVARAIHKMSPRGPMPFVAINCGTLSREFLASEIFGHRRGAFTGAVNDKLGLLAKAEGGTLFLDEVAELPMDVQAMLLRVLQERRYTPLGDTRDKHADIRIISATHASLRKAVEKGTFREDLMFRLRVVPVFLPPLRQRKGDISLLWQHMIEQSVARMNVPPPHMTDAFLQHLEHYSWPGNIRELINLAEYITVTRSGKKVTPEHLHPEFHEKKVTEQASSEGRPEKPARVGHKLDREVIEQAINEANGSTEDAAQLLGVSRITLWRWRKKLGLT